MFRDSRQSVLVLIAAFGFLTLGLAAGANGYAQTSKKNAKPTPTTKKTAKATTTPAKKTQAKATPTTKKSQTTTAKSKTADKKTADKKTADKKSTAKTDPKDRNSKDKKTASKTDSKSATAKDKSARTKKDANNAKSTTGKNSTVKSGSKTASKTASKTEPKTKDPKTASKKTEPKTTTTAKKSSAEKTAASRKRVEPKTVSKPKPEETATTEEDAPRFVVTDVSAPVRAAASAKSAELGTVKLGTVLNVSQKNASWYKVQYSNGAKTSAGWIAATAVSSLDQANKPQIYTQAANRYYKPQMDFATASALYEFLTRNQSDYDNSDAAADLQLKRLLALRAALKAIPVSEKNDTPYKNFLAAHGKEIVYSEPSGEYLTISNLFWDLHKKYKTAASADEIAWAGAQNPLPGECEGYVNCHLFYARMTSGEYLSLHPIGKHSLEALTNLTNLLTPIVADLDKKQIYNGPTDVTDRAEFNNLIAELRTIVSRLPLTEKEKTLQQLKKIAEGFR